MNWKVISSLVLLNILFSLCMMFGLLGNVQWWLGILVDVVLALILCWFVTTKLFMHGFITGIIGGIAGALITFMFWDTFVANNPQMSEAMAKMPNGGSLRTITLVTSPIGAAIGGVIIGVLALLFGKLLGKVEDKPKPQEVTATTSEQPDDKPQS
jgi:hypothetical protein